MRGTYNAYNKLTTKNDDTLYFIYDEDSNESALYLGSRKIASAEGDSLNTSSIDALADVLITENLTDKSFLVYNDTQKQWINTDFKNLSFVGATALSSGVSGFVPAPEINQTDLFLRSDGTWAKIQESTNSVVQNIINITNESSLKHSDIIINATIDLTVAKGDIIIIKDLIQEDKYKHTAYVYDGIEWMPLNGFSQAEDIIFAEDIAEIPAAGENLKTVLANMVSELTVSADNTTIVVENKQFSLKNYGLQYYKYIPESGSETSGDFIAAHYELQIVDSEHPWIPGLEPRVATENGQLVLAWFEQNPTTIDGINAQVSTLQTNVQDLQQVTENLNTIITNKADIDTVYTKEEVNSKITESIIAADHLKRKIVSAYKDIQSYIDTYKDADQYIFMVPIGVTDYDNKYEEYIVIDGLIEPVGNWSVNLDDYVTKNELQTSLSTKVNKVDNARLMLNSEAEKLESIEAGAQVNFINSVDSTIFKVENKQLNLVTVPISKVTNLTNILNNKVDKVAGSRLITEEEAAKLAKLEENYISAVDETQFAVTDKKLTLLDIAISKVTNLQNILNNKVNKEELDPIKTDITSLDERVTLLEETSGQVSNAVVWEDL